MARPPLPLGTAGKTRFISSGPRWIARCGFRDYDGVTRLVERSGPSKAAAERALKQAIRDRAHQGRSGDINPDTKVKVAAEAWWKTFCRLARELNTLDQYQKQLKQHVLPAVGNLRCRELSVAIAENFLRTVEDKHGKAVAKLVRTVLSNICAFAARMGAMDRNPVRDTTPVSTKPKKGPPLALDAHEIRQLRAYATYHPLADERAVPEVIDFMAATGLRIGECLAVLAEDVDIAEGTISVCGTVISVSGMGVMIKREPKTTAGNRTLALPTWAIPSVRACVARAVTITATVFKDPDNGTTHLLLPSGPTKRSRKTAEQWLADKLARGNYSTAEVSLLLPSVTDGIWDPSKVSRCIKDVFVLAGIPDNTSHILRKSVATQMDDAGYSARVIADQLGHADPAMTLRVYLGRSNVSTAGAAALEPVGG